MFYPRLARTVRLVILLNYTAAYYMQKLIYLGEIISEDDLNAHEEKKSKRRTKIGKRRRMAEPEVEEESDEDRPSHPFMDEEPEERDSDQVLDEENEADDLEKDDNGDFHDGNIDDRNDDSDNVEEIENP